MLPDQVHAGRALELAGHTFYLRDGLLQVWLAVMADALAADAQPAAWKWRLEDDFRYQATLRFDGLLAARLDPHLDGTGDGERDARREAFVTLVRRVRAQVADPSLSLGPLAERLCGDRCRRSVRKRLARIADALLWMSRGTDCHRNDVGETMGDR